MTAFEGSLVKQDVLDALSGKFPKQVPCKESLNDPKIVEYVSGVDPFEDTPRAFAIAWGKLGIDIHVPLSAGNAPRPKVPGGTWVENMLAYFETRDRMGIPANLSRG